MIELLNKIHFSDCLELLRKIPDSSIDLLLQDPPYGTTALSWDNCPNLPLMWLEWERILKPNGAFIFTAQQPFTSELVMSRAGLFKYELIWEKSRPSNYLNAKKMPLKSIENILVFYRLQPTYNPQGLIPVNKIHKNSKTKNQNSDAGKSAHNGGRMSGDFLQEFKNYPRQVLKFNSETGLHPTQKPVELWQYLIKTYSNEGDIVFDGYSGSGTTAIACLKEKRQFICCENNFDYYEKSSLRVENERSNLTLA